MTHRRVAIALTLVATTGLVAVPRLARAQGGDGDGDGDGDGGGRHYRMRHLPSGLLAAELRHSQEIDDHSYNDGWLRVVPDEFVGRAGACGAGYPAGANIVQAAWLRGIGLPDGGQPNANPADPRDNPVKGNARFGLLLSKNGPTADCSAAGARIVGTLPIFTIVELGFDTRNGTHCGAGAPRFNIVTRDGLVYFAGCADGTRSPAPQEPTEWTRVRFSSPQIFPQNIASPAFELGVTEVRALSIVHDEGTDTGMLDEPSGVGLVVIDNIDINGHLLTDGRN